MALGKYKNLPCDQYSSDSHDCLIKEEAEIHSERMLSVEVEAGHHGTRSFTDFGGMQGSLDGTWWISSWERDSTSYLGNAVGHLSEETP